MTTDAVIGQGEPAATEAATAANPTRVRPAPSLSERAWRIGVTIIRRDSTVRRALALADVLALGTALVLAAGAGGGSVQLPALAAVPILIVLVKVSGLYDRDANLLRRSTLDELPALFQLATLSTLLLWLAGGAVVTGGIDAGQALILWASLFALMAVLRSAARALARRVTPVERCLFVGDNPSAVEFRDKLAASRGVNAELVCLVAVDGGPPPGANGGWAASLVPQIGQLAFEHGAQRVVLAPGPGASEELVNSVREIKDLGLKVSVLPRHARVAGSAVALDRLDGITLLGVQRFHITRSSRVVKRAFDLAGSIAGLVVLAPLAAAIAIAIRIDTPGPILYRQRRTGRDGREFEMLKFRSMVDGADAQRPELAHLNEADGVFKLRRDPRVTRVGRVIRPYSLDELPQLVNVLRGEMSLVGPRPLPLDEDRLVEGWQRRRLELRPGITGPWQLLGPTRVPLSEMVNLDNQYIADWSLWTDIRILLMTIPHVIGRRGI
jgi:exopolysaccharide biosynthesis polyprenyl glycosylphosphotransferase